MIPDAYDMWVDHEARQQRELEEYIERLPICSECGQPMMCDWCYEINGELVCEHCIEEHRKSVEDFVK
jgi:formylmethanofuran dehydrogenase subunit E